MPVAALLGAIASRPQWECGLDSHRACSGGVLSADKHTHTHNPCTNVHLENPAYKRTQVYTVMHGQRYRQAHKQACTASHARMHLRRHAFHAGSQALSMCAYFKPNACNAHQHARTHAFTHLRRHALHVGLQTCVPRPQGHVLCTQALQLHLRRQHSVVVCKVLAGCAYAPTALTAAPPTPQRA